MSKIRMPEEILQKIDEGAREYAIEKGQRSDPLSERDVFMKSSQGRRLYDEYLLAMRERAEHPEAFRPEPEVALLTKSEKRAADVITKIESRASVIQKSSKLTKQEALSKVFAEDPSAYVEYRNAVEVSTGAGIANG